MAGFEVIVRPVVFPNIRPAPTRSLPPADDPEQGQAVFSGGSGQVIALTHSFSASGSRPGGTETERTYDTVRITEEGKADPEGRKGRSSRAGGDSGAFIDVEVVTQLRLRDDKGNASVYNYTPIEESGNVTIIERNQTRTSE